ncbi:hypothetical protein NOC27_2799 [Nitrosococcus oceani AFC27]|nr:hypothetical protein NOC27_2799 [Nitrosococcus oceani AFC27]
MNTAHVLARELKRFLPWHQARLDCLSQLIMVLIQGWPLSRSISMI